MKKTLAFILAILCVGAMVSGCGKKAENENTPSNSSIGTTSTESSGSKKEDDVNFKTFDELPSVECLSAFDDDKRIYAYLNCADWSKDNTDTYFVAQEAQEYGILVCCADSLMPGKSINDCFYEVYQDKFGITLDSFSSEYGSGSGFVLKTPKITGKALLPCGAEAVKFEVEQPSKFDDYNSCYIYGYGFMFNDLPMIVSFAVKCDYKDDLGDAKMAELTKYVDEMVQTVRTQP